MSTAANADGKYPISIEFFPTKTPEGAVKQRRGVDAGALGAAAALDRHGASSAGFGFGGAL